MDRRHVSLFGMHSVTVLMPTTALSNGLDAKALEA